jgi:hypothetical protein
VGEVYGDAWAKGALIARMAYQWVLMWRVSCTYHGCNISKPIHAFYLHSFSSKMLVKGYFPGLVTSGGNVSHNHFTEMRRLARDDTPFLLAMPLRSTTLAW